MTKTGLNHKISEPLLHVWLLYHSGIRMDTNYCNSAERMLIAC